MRAHKKHVRIIGTMIPPFEGATSNAAGLSLSFYTPERERVRQSVNEWIRRSGLNLAQSGPGAPGLGVPEPS